jgi:hypothetical protein
MTWPDRSRGGILVAGTAIVLGVLVAWFDVVAPFGDDTEKGTLLLWLTASGVLGLLAPGRPWRWALLIGPWVPAAHLILHALGRPHSMNPNTYTVAMILVPISLVVCLLAAYGGSLIRHAMSELVEPK